MTTFLYSAILLKYPKLTTLSGDFCSFEVLKSGRLNLFKDVKDGKPFIIVNCEDVCYNYKILKDEEDQTE